MCSRTSSQASQFSKQNPPTVSRHSNIGPYRPDIRDERGKHLSGRVTTIGITPRRGDIIRYIYTKLDRIEPRRRRTSRRIFPKIFRNCGCAQKQRRSGSYPKLSIDPLTDVHSHPAIPDLDNPNTSLIRMNFYEFQIPLH